MKVLNFNDPYIDSRGNVNNLGDMLSGELASQLVTNLLNPTLQSQVINGMMITNNGDGTYTLSGTFIGDTPLIPVGQVRVKGVHRLVGTQKENFVPGNYLQIFDDTTQTWKEADRSDGLNFNFEDGHNYTIMLVLRDGCTYNNYVYKPMITTDLSATYDDFVAYTGSSGTLNGDVAKLTKIVKNIVNCGRCVCDVVSNQVNSVRASDIVSGTFPSNPARCVYNVSGFYSNIDYNIKVLSDSSRFIISPTISQRISITWIEIV